jgi:hypothetical protein
MSVPKASGSNSQGVLALQLYQENSGKMETNIIDQRNGNQLSRSRNICYQMRRRNLL